MTCSPPTKLTGLGALTWFPRFFHDHIGTLETLRKRYGTAVAIKVPWRRTSRWGLVVAGRVNTREVLSKPDTYHSMGVGFRGRSGSDLSRLNRGLLGMNGQLHRDQRRHVTSLFGPKAIESYYPQMVDITERQLRQLPTDTEVRVDKAAAGISLRIAACNLITGDIEAADKIGQLTEDHLRKSYSRRTVFFPFNLPGTPYRQLLQHATYAVQYYEQIIDGRIASGLAEDDMFNRLIQVHLDDPISMPRDRVVEQAAVIFAASHETVAKAVTWTLFLLAQHPHIFAELAEELADSIGDDPPSLQDLQELPLLDAITKESMRLFPPVPWTLRKVRADGELGGMPVRHSDFVVLNHYSTHRCPEVFPDPLQFRPERWFGADLDPYAYVPFSAGPRACIGKALGTTMINLIVARFVQRFSFQVVPNARICRTVRVTLRPKYGLPMILAPKTRTPAAVKIRGNVHQMVELNRSDATTYDPKAALIPFPLAAEIGEQRSDKIRRAA